MLFCSAFCAFLNFVPIVGGDQFAFLCPNPFENLLICYVLPYNYKINFVNYTVIECKTKKSGVKPDLTS